MDEGDLITLYLLTKAGNDSCFMWTLSLKWFIVLSGDCTYKEVNI